MKPPRTSRPSKKPLAARRGAPNGLEALTYCLALGLGLLGGALRAQDDSAAAQSQGPAAAQSQAPAAVQSQAPGATQSQAPAAAQSDAHAPAPSAAAGGAATRPHAAATPEGTVELLYRGLVAAASDDLDVQERYRRLEPFIQATHDLPYIAELTIRRKWDDLAPDQRRRFVAAFERLSIMTYASRFGQLGPDMFKVTGEGDAGDDRAEVKAALTTRDGKVIPFDYLLHRADGGWKIVNILADRVSDLALKRAEYREVLEKGSVDELIRHIEKQTENAERDAQVKNR